MLLVVCAPLAGCIGGVSPFGDGDDFGPVWHSDTPANPGGSHHPAVAAREGDETAVAVGFGDTGANRTCSFVALNGSGGTRWTRAIPRDACGTQPTGDAGFGDVNDDGRLDVAWATHERRLYAADATNGTLVLNATFPRGMPFVRPVVTRDPTLVVLPLMTGGVRAYAPNGTLAWNRTFEYNVRGQEPQLVTTANGTRSLIVGTTDGLIALDPATGATRWRRHEPARFLRAGTLDGRTVLLASGQNGETDGTHVEAVAANGTRLWYHRGEGTGTLAVGAVGRPAPGVAPRAYVTSANGRLTAYALADGRAVWNRTLDRERHYVPPPTLADLDGDGNRSVVATTAYGPMRAYDAADGASRGTWAWNDDDVAVWAGLRSADVDGDGDDEVLAVTTDAQVVAVGDEP
ncbi:outer membrane protein assembly factor BamB family protein [Halarchaeum acidiphilum]|uniref:outer membrane protein assembly factor BamB family protein n=2 Tax=Halarchaeum acidiphilum TaxID=489138 RepID=UPI00131EEFF0|nr:PQQ-binding-like beta-propeller repeat protein [Halarchaeum acidiphilum]